MYRMVSEYGNELKIVKTTTARNELIAKGWREEKPEIVKPHAPKAEIVKETKGVKASEKRSKSGKNI